MSLTPQFLDELRARTHLSALVGRTLKLTKAGREFKGCCPFHNEKTPSFYVNDEKGFYHCFGCSAHGDAIRWMTDQRGLGFMDAVKELAEAAGMDVPAPDPRAAEKAEKANSLYDVMTAAADWFREQLDGLEGGEARDYIQRRGLTPETIKTFGIGYAPDSRSKLKAALSHFGNEMLVEAGLLIKVDDKEPYDRFRGRLMIPIRDPRGRVIAFGGRILGAGEPKYLNSPDTPLFDKGRTLYNLDLAAKVSRQSNRIIVVEGYLDVIMLTQGGIADVVAPLGTALTEQQLEMVWRYSNVPLLCFDGDAPGQKAALRAAHRALPNLKPGFSLDFVSLPEGKDPADMVQNGAISALQAQFLNGRATLSKVLWEAEVIQQDCKTPEARAGLKSKLLDMAGSIKDQLVAAEYKATFNDLFWETFGWGRRAVAGVRDSMSSYRTKVRKSLYDAYVRAILLGFMRYSNLLHERFEQLASLHVDDPNLIEWRKILLERVVGNHHLDENLIDTILAQSDVTPIEQRDLTKDLGFSFYFKGRDEAERHLIEVVETLNQEREFEISLARKTERFKASFQNSDWEEQQEMLKGREAARQKLREFGELVEFSDERLTG